MSNAIKCPVCASVANVLIGRLPVAYHFCSNLYNKPINPGSLYKCARCSLVYRSPCLCAEELIALYSRQAKGLWGGDVVEQVYRHDFKSVLDVIDRLYKPNAKVLDVGCFTGALLIYIQNNSIHGSRFSLDGVEPSLEAAELAKSRGINIKGRSVFDINVGESSYDFVVLTDVFEHLVDSYSVLAAIKRILKPDGKIILVTGAADSGPFLTFGSNYYYVAMPEHVIFISRKHAEWLCGGIGVKLLEYTEISHSDASRSVLSQIKLIIKAGLFYILKCIPDVMFTRVCGPFWARCRKVRGYGVPNFRLKDDHCIVVFENC